MGTFASSLGAQRPVSLANRNNLEFGSPAVTADKALAAEGWGVLGAFGRLTSMTGPEADGWRVADQAAGGSILFSLLGGAADARKDAHGYAVCEPFGVTTRQVHEDWVCLPIAVQQEGVIPGRPSIPLPGKGGHP